MPAGLDPTLRRLDNGLRVVAVEDTASPAVAVNIWYAVGSRNEQPHRTGFAHLFEHLMFQGSRNVSGNGHFSLLMGAGGTLNGSTTTQRTNYYETVPANAVDLALWLEADRMETLLDAVTQTNLDNQRDVVKNERRQRYDNVPYGTALERLFAGLFPPGHPYHHTTIGSMADLDAASLDDVHAFFRTWYAPDNAVLSIVGNLPVPEALDLAERHFGAIPPRGDFPARPTLTAEPLGQRVEVEVTDEEVPREAVYAAFRLPPDGTHDCDAADLALTLLAQGAASRLTERMTRRERLAAGVSVYLLRQADAASIGIISLRALPGVTPETLTAAYEQELLQLAAEVPDVVEVERAGAQAERDHLSDLQTVAVLADALSGAVTSFGDPATLDGGLESLLAVTPEEITAVATRWLQPQDQVLLSYRLPAA